jgi:hypothetical protein
MLEQVGAIETANVKTEVEGLDDDVKRLISSLEQLNAGDCSLYSIGAVQTARGAVKQAGYSIRDVYDPSDRFSSQRSQGR